MHLSADEFLECYRRQATHVVAQSQKGPTVKSAAGKLQRLVPRDGMRGRFELSCGPDRAFIDLERLSGWSDPIVCVNLNPTPTYGSRSP